MHAVGKKQSIVIGIALQTHVLKACPVHRQVYVDDEADPANAFALAVELVRQGEPFVQDFYHDTHALTDLLSETLGTAPAHCGQCL